MDFLTLLVCYIVTSVVVVVAYLAEDSPALKTGAIGRCRSSVYRGLVWALQKLPLPVWRRLLHLYDKVFYKQNAVFQALYVAMVMSGHVVLVMDCLPYLYTVDPEHNHVVSPSACLVLNSVCFVVCCYSDAGVVNKKNVHRYQKAYSPDGVLYKEESTCCTCHLSKPARSKHCAIADRCFFKFDHYCAWTNNCVGGLNHRWFMLFLLSLIAMCTNAVVMSVNALINVTAIYQLMTLRYVDAAGLAQPMTFRVLIQTLFMQLPRLVFLVAALTVIAVCLSGFFIYHSYLIVTNQTTNERYKRYYLRKNESIALECHPYSRGIIMNILEEMFPLRFKQGPFLHNMHSIRSSNSKLNSTSEMRTNGSTSLRAGERKKKR